MAPLPVGKLPPELLARLLGRLPARDPRVLLPAGPGLDCAVIAPPVPGAANDTLLVVKSDPITFATAEIGWYLVHVNVNDLATTGATPRWLMITLLLPEHGATPEFVEAVQAQVVRACETFGITIVGGHTEVTAGLPRPLLVGALLGEVARDRLVTPRGARPGDRVLLTKGVPIEATALLAREFPERVGAALTAPELRQAQDFLFDPGLSILRDAQIAQAAGPVTAMHDPTEGGLAAALWELAEASARGLDVDLSAAPVPALAARVCAACGVDPLAAIASGALLLTAPAEAAPAIRRALEAAAIPCAEIGAVTPGPAVVRTTAGVLPRPAQDAVAALFAAAP